MEMREILIILMCFAIGPLLIYSDGGIMSDYRLRNETLVPMSKPTSLSFCRSRVKYYHYCRYHMITDEHDATFRYRLLNNAPMPVKNIQYFKSAETNEITTNIGLKYFWHRVFFIALISLSAAIKAVYEIGKHFSFTKQTTPSKAPHRVEPSIRPARDGSGGATFGKKIY